MKEKERERKRKREGDPEVMKAYTATRYKPVRLALNAVPHTL